MRRPRVATLVGVLVLTGWATATFPNASPSAAAASGWDFPTADQVMLVEPNGKWHLRNPAGPDRTFWYGVPGDTPLLGDWNGDGVDTPGMYRPSSGYAYLSNTFPADGEVGMGDSELTFYFGRRGDQVFSGDWDGDGIDTLGIFRKGKVYLADTNATVVADREFWFGAPSDVAFGGDADGDGIDGVFLYRPSTGFTYFTNAVPVGPDVIAPTDGELFFGTAGDRFVVGDYDNDMTDTVGVFRPDTSTVYLRNSNTTGSADEEFSFGTGAWTPVAGRVGDFMREVVVSPVGTEAQSGAALRDAASFVTTQKPSGSQPWVIGVEPGIYNLFDGGPETGVTGLDLADYTSLIGAGSGEVTLTGRGAWFTGIRADHSSLEGFTLDVETFQGTGISLGDGIVRNVILVGRLDRGGLGMEVGSASLHNVRLEILARENNALALRATGDTSLTDSVVDIGSVSEFYSATAIANWGNLEMTTSTVRAWSSSTGSNDCFGIVSEGPFLAVQDSVIESCVDDSDPPFSGVGVMTNSADIADSYIRADWNPVAATGPVSVTDSVVAGGAVSGNVSCNNVTDGHGIWFASQCPGQPFLYRVNAGGPLVAAVDGGPAWSTDTKADPSQFVNVTAESPDNTTAAWNITAADPSLPATAPLDVFESERWDAPGGAGMRWNFPTAPEERVEVRLYFASGYDGASEVGDRLFDVTIDGVPVLKSYDIVADVGHRVGVMKSFLVTADSDGIDIVLHHLNPPVQNPLINAIEILVPEN